MRSNFNISVTSSDWEDRWYWGKKVEYMEEHHLEHSQLLALSKVPLLIIAGHYDNEGTNAFFDRAALIRGDRENMILDDHKSGHRIPPESMEKAIHFLRKYMNVKER